MDSAIRTIFVETEPPYPVLIGPGLLADCGARLRPLLGARRAAVITDGTVAPLCLQPVLRSLEAAGFAPVSHVFPAGESHKNLETFSAILEFLARERLTRAGCVVALGGGVVGDMAGFAAGCYLRGVDCVQLPTTLLSAVDSSVGGKTAVDLAAGKNLAGIFAQPAAVLCDVDCLATLPERTLADGAAEAVKTGVLFDEALFHQFSGGLPRGDALSEVIARCVAWKAGVVKRDPKERDQRRLLNLGHTVGHAIERCSGYAVPHGHAVAAGLAVIARAAEKRGWCDAPCAGEITRTLSACGLPAGTDFSARELAEAALSDKKRTGDTIALVIPRRVGLCVLKTLPVTELADVIAAGLED